MKIFISGFGTVGQGIMEAILLKDMDIQKMTGDKAVIVGVADSKSYVIKDDGVCCFSVLGGKNVTGKVGPNMKDGKTTVDIMKMVEFDTLIEATPTNVETGGEGLVNIRWALENGKNVITANKGPLALEFAELMAIAREKGCQLRFEGTVGGAMPIINLCNDALAGQKIRSIQGILNGTCNFILSRMGEGLPFGHALKEAQQLGYAETDPINDVEGYDSASKAVILANSVFGVNAKFKDVDITGITTITSEAITLAKDNGMVIRLIGEISKDKLEVSPRLIPRGHPLSITGSLNIALINTDLAGPITVSGRGAGRKETASSILSDLIAIMKTQKN